MYVAVETWTAKPEFLAAPVKTKEELFARIKVAMVEMAPTGIVTLGWGSEEKRYIIAAPDRLSRPPGSA